ncbi:MAG: cupin domain-containing protein [Acidimicrobiia bacterium]
MAHVLIEDLAGTVEIPSEGTLSRVVAKPGPVRLVMFAFDQGQELTEHTASVPVVLQVVSGRLVVTVDGDRHVLTPSAWLYLDADQPHSVFAEEPSRLLLTMIRPA